MLIVVTVPAIELVLKGLKRDGSRNLPIKLFVIGFMKAFDFSIEFLESRGDEFVSDFEFHQKRRKRMNDVVVERFSIESIFSSVRASSLRVTNWTAGKNQMVRWTAALLLEAEHHIKRIPGYKEIPYFLTQLKNLPLNKQKNVA